MGVRGEATQWRTGTCGPGTSGAARREPAAPCELTKRSFSEDVLGDYRTLYTSHVPVPGPALGPAALLSDLLTPPLPSPEVSPP